jgi:hypothetical protein
MKIEVVDFHGEQLEGVKDEDGEIWTSFRRICENLGVSYRRQLRKLRGRSWAVVAQKATTGPDGKIYQMECVNLNTLSMWLATLNENKISDPAVRAKIVRYQIEAARVLRDHFFRSETEIARFVLGKGEIARPASVPEEIWQILSGPRRMALHALAQGADPLHVRRTFATGEHGLYQAAYHAGCAALNRLNKQRRRAVASGKDVSDVDRRLEAIDTFMDGAYGAYILH